MPDSRTIASTNIHKNYSKEEERIIHLRGVLRSHTLVGQVLRVLIRRLKYPHEPYTSPELQVLLMLSLAELEP